MTNFQKYFSSLKFIAAICVLLIVPCSGRFPFLIDGDKPCVFTCSQGIPTANPDYVPTSNGCGTADLHIDFDKRNLLGFNSCCDSHDICYATCNVDKNECDDEFLSCLLDQCNSVDKNSKDCSSTAQWLGGMVKNYGCQPYLSSQKLACECSTK